MYSVGKMIDRHWNGIAAYCKAENKVALGFVEGLKNKVRVIQRRAYGLRDEVECAPSVGGFCRQVDDGLNAVFL